jgi:hypothetical protein
MTVSYDNKIYHGQVISNYDLESKGSLRAKIPEFGDDAYLVVYTSPYLTRNGGGMVAIPEIGSEILVYYIREKNKFYYLSTIVDIPDEFDNSGLKDWSVIKDKYVFTERGIPQRVTFTDSFGAGLAISSRSSKKYISAKVDLKSRMGKMVSLSDSPNSDMVMIRNEHGDGVAISSEPSEVYSERSIEIKSKGAQRNVSFQSGIDTVVVEGKDITLENYSSGSHSTAGRFGNINLRSHNADINIVGKGQDSRIFIITPKARIQIENDGSVKIESNANIQLSTDGNFNVKAGSFSVDANSINMKSATNITLDANASISAKGGVIASIDAATLHLNSGVSQPAVTNPNIPLNTTSYRE